MYGDSSKINKSINYRHRFTESSGNGRGGEVNSTLNCLYIYFLGRVNGEEYNLIEAIYPGLPRQKRYQIGDGIRASA
jgi:hypothetical protein